MKRFALVLLLLLGPLAAPRATATLQPPPDLKAVNRRLHGQIVDYTDNHGCDRRIWSPALCQKRDLYVYLPPGFDPSRAYPIVLWLHGFAQDEQSFVRDVIEPLDKAIACGKLPPFIMAAPDGSLSGEGCISNPGSFFLNSRAGRYEDFVMQDVWGFLLKTYPIRPEREAHILAGVSMGGGAAYNLGIKYRHCFKAVLGIFPPLNVRWLDCHGNYMANFDPCCWGWREEIRHKGIEIVGRFYGVVIITGRMVWGPLFGNGQDAIASLSRENPIEMLERYGVQEGELAMFVGYGSRDQFNIDAQVESFLYRCKQMGLTVTVDRIQNGHHDRETARKIVPCAIEWLAVQLAPYACQP